MALRLINAFTVAGTVLDFHELPCHESYSKGKASLGVGNHAWQSFSAATMIKAKFDVGYDPVGFNGNSKSITYFRPVRFFCNFILGGSLRLTPCE